MAKQFTGLDLYSKTGQCRHIYYIIYNMIISQSYICFFSMSLFLIVIGVFLVRVYCLVLYLGSCWLHFCTDVFSMLCYMLFSVRGDGSFVLACFRSLLNSE